MVQSPIAKSRFGEEIEEYLRLKGKTTRGVYSSAFSLFLEFYEAYAKYCGHHDLSVLDKNVVGKELPRLIPSVRSYKPKIDDKQVYCWKGIKIIPESWEE